MSYGCDNKKNTGSQKENTNNTNKTNNNDEMKNASCNERQRRFVVFVDEKINFYNVNAGTENWSCRKEDGEYSSINCARVNASKNEKFDFAAPASPSSFVVDGFCFFSCFFLCVFLGNRTNFFAGCI